MYKQHLLPYLERRNPDNSHPHSCFRILRTAAATSSVTSSGYSFAKCPCAPHSPVMIACLTVLLRSVGFCNVSIRPAIFLLITGKPNSCKISVFGFLVAMILLKLLCTLIMLLSSRDDTDTAGTMIPYFLKSIKSTMLSNLLHLHVHSFLCDQVLV